MRGLTTIIQSKDIKQIRKRFYTTLDEIEQQRGGGKTLRIRDRNFVIAGIRQKNFKQNVLIEKRKKMIDKSELNNLGRYWIVENLPKGKFFHIINKLWKIKIENQKQLCH